MKIINSKEEFEDYYWYKKSSPDKDEYPTHYPCIAKYVFVDGGGMNDYTWHRIIYFPKGVDNQSFFKGVEAYSKAIQ